MENIAMAHIRNDEVIETLNDLVENCKDGEYGFNELADHTQSPELRALFRNRALECSEAAAELQRAIAEHGGTPESGGSMAGAVHRGWVSVRSVLSSATDQAMLEECERGEDAALRRYRQALQRELPPAVATLIARQAEGAQRNHDQIKALRDSFATTTA
jgi:uncharacterized protein (TIGR02284 family)